MITTKNRLNWIDWMKTIGMYVIIIGHTFPEGLCAFVYSFSVPLFFFLSGFLNKRTNSWKECIIKIINSLLIPYFLICAGNLIIMYFQEDCAWSSQLLLQKLLYITIGLHNLFGVKGCGSMWFVYTLIITQLFYYWCNGNKKRIISLCICCLLGTLLFNHIIHKGFGWAITNMMLAFPYYAAGNLFCSHYPKLSSHNKWLDLAIALMVLIILYFSSNINGPAYMYLGWYGDYILLFFINGFLGIYLIFLLSNVLDSVRLLFVNYIAIGNILILGFHEQFLCVLKYHIFTSFGEYAIIYQNLTKILFSLIILMVFIPVIMWTKRYFPILLGRR